MPMRLFFGTIGVGILLSGAFVAGAITLLFGLAWAFGARAFRGRAVPELAWHACRLLPGRLLDWSGRLGAADWTRDALLILLSVWWPTLHRGIAFQLWRFV